MKSFPAVLFLLTILAVSYTPLNEEVRADPATGIVHVVGTYQKLIISNGLAVAILAASACIIRHVTIARGALLAIVIAVNGYLLAINIYAALG